MFLIKADNNNYINIDKIIKVNIDKDNEGNEYMYVITSDDDVHEVLPEYRPVIQSWLNVADERTQEDKPNTKRKNNWGDGIEPLCVKGVWSEGKKPVE